MTTTPKGYTELTNASAMSGPEQINAAERFVEDLIGETAATIASLPSSGNWLGRTIAVGGRLHVWNGAWAPQARRLGVQRNTADTIPAGTPSWTDICTVTATSAGGPCVADWVCRFRNANSGSARILGTRVLCDGAQVEDVLNYDVPLGDNTGKPAAYRVESTPTAGVHTWKFQCNGSVASAIYVDHAVLTVMEY